MPLLAAWGDLPNGRSHRGASAASRAELARQQDEAAALLRAAGWTMAMVPAGCPVEQVWAELGRHAGAPTLGADTGVPA